MRAEMIPMIMVEDVKTNVDYLTLTLGFHVDLISADGCCAIVNYCGALLMLRSRNDGQDGMIQSNVEIIIQTDDIEQVYKRALSSGAIVREYIVVHTAMAGTVSRRFSVSLPDGYALIFRDDLSKKTAGEAQRVSTASNEQLAMEEFAPPGQELDNLA